MPIPSSLGQIFLGLLVQSLPGLLLRPSPPSVTKSMHEGPPFVKPTRDELLAPVEALSRRRRSAKRKPEASPERSRPDRGKTLRLGASSPSSSAKIRVKGQALPPLAEVPRVTGLRRRSSPVAETKGPSGRAAQSPFYWRLCVFLFGILRYRALSSLIRCRRT